MSVTWSFQVRVETPAVNIFLPNMGLNSRNATYLTLYAPVPLPTSVTFVIKTSAPRRLSRFFFDEGNLNDVDRTSF